MGDIQREGSRETQRECPSCESTDKRIQYLVSNQVTSGRNWAQLRSGLTICRHDWHGTPAAPETPPDQNEEAFVLELAAIYGLDESFMRALPVPTLEMWKMLVRTEARRHKSERETMEKFRKELCDLKFGAKTPRKEEA